MSEWQPIETAPKDGTHILVCARADYSPSWGFNQSPPSVAHYFTDPEEPGFYLSNGTRNPDAPMDEWLSHWMPLPTPPKSITTKGEE